MYKDKPRDRVFGAADGQTTDRGARSIGSFGGHVGGGSIQPLFFVCFLSEYLQSVTRVQHPQVDRR